MTTPQPADLDGFESALLTELRTVVADRSAAAGASPSALPHRAVVPLWRRRSARWIVGTAAVAAGISSLALLPGGGTPAYAVSSDKAGDVTVTVSRLEGADGLVKALAAKGIRADVTYLPAGKACAEGRFTDAPPNNGGIITARMDEHGETFTLPANLLGSGQTLVLTSAWRGDREWSIQLGIAAGAVAPCRQVAAPH